MKIQTCQPIFLLIVVYFVLLFTIVCQQQKHLYLSLSHHTKYLILHMQHTKSPLMLKWNFTSTQIVLDQSLINTKFYLDQDKNYPFNPNSYFKIFYSKIHHQINDQQQSKFLGYIGLAQQNNFMIGLKKLLNVSDIKLWFRISENYVQVIPLKCFKPIFPPYYIQLSTWSTTNFISKGPSFNFEPGQTFLALLNKTNNPFQMTSQQLTQVVNLKFENQSIIMRKKQLMKSCSKFSPTSSEKSKMKNEFECQLSLHKRKDNSDSQNGDIGRLIMQFEPVICQNGIQLQPTIGSHQESSGFYWLHLILLILQIGVFLYFALKESFNNQKQQKKYQNYKR